MAGYTPLPFAQLKGPTVAGMETCENWKEKHSPLSKSGENPRQRIRSLQASAVLRSGDHGASSLV